MSYYIMCTQGRSGGQQEIIGLPDERDQTEIDGAEKSIRQFVLQR